MELVKNRRLASSAKWCTLQNLIALCKSFIYSKNRMEPKTEEIEEKEELQPFRDIMFTFNEV